MIRESRTSTRLVPQRLSLSYLSIQNILATTVMAEQVDSSFCFAYRDLSLTFKLLAGQPEQSLIPEGYTFLNPTTMVSKKAKELFQDWVDQIEKCNPDNFDMYIYNGECLPLINYTGGCSYQHHRLRVVWTVRRGGSRAPWYTLKD